MLVVSTVACGNPACRKGIITANKRGRCSFCGARFRIYRRRRAVKKICWQY